MRSPAEREQDRAMQAWLFEEHAAVYHGSDDPRTTNFQLRATRYLAVLARLLGGAAPVGGREHVDLLDYERHRDSFVGEILEHYRALELDAVLRDDDAVSRTTAWRRRKRAATGG